ncbi:MAG: hypothetical protein ACLP9L_27805 [Thermoguttaceae bacterium]
MRKVCLLIVVGCLCLVYGQAFGAITNHYAPVAPGQGVIFDYAPENAGGVTPDGGGPFIGHLYLNPSSSTAVGAPWRTYCVEAGTNGGDQTFVPTTDYLVFSVTTDNAVDTNNFVSLAAKWLYNASVNGSLPGYTLTQAHEISLQEAIWQNTYVNPFNSNGVSTGNASPVVLNTPADAQALAWSADAQAAVAAMYTSFATDGSGDYIGYNGLTAAGLGLDNSVKILNPSYTDGTGKVVQVQSMLYSTVPEPASLIVWSVLGAGAAMALRRRRSVARWSAENRQAIHAVIEGKLHG